MGKSNQGMGSVMVDLGKVELFTQASLSGKGETIRKSETLNIGGKRYWVTEYDPATLATGVSQPATKGFKVRKAVGPVGHAAPSNVAPVAPPAAAAMAAQDALAAFRALLHGPAGEALRATLMGAPVAVAPATPAAVMPAPMAAPLAMAAGARS